MNASSTHIICITIKNAVKTKIPGTKTFKNFNKISENIYFWVTAEDTKFIKISSKLNTVAVKYRITLAKMPEITGL